METIILVNFSSFFSIFGHQNPESGAVSKSESTEPNAMNPDPQHWFSESITTRKPKGLNTQNIILG
jgi:hypothetical protein